MENLELKPCSKCGIYPSICVVPLDGDYRWFYKCPSCFWQTISYISEREAQEKWNKLLDGDFVIKHVEILDGNTLIENLKIKELNDAQEKEV